ncbi:DUF3846 domain-containing protein [Streptomyces lutosisoli]|uniref:DUF3846 domain-containing protein n=1 Tax=Streptomyces lutosisoli TaxID=2665721 RepID=A0ABW2VWD8_9ACTN
MSITTIASADESFALLIQPSGMFRLLAWVPVSTPRHALCCDTARPVDVTTALTMWVCEDAAALGEKPNTAAYGLLSLYLPGQLPYFGDVVFTGIPDAEGNARGLSPDQAVALLGLYLEHAATGLMPRPRT